MKKVSPSMGSPSGIHILKETLSHAPARDFLKRFVENQARRTLAYMDHYQSSEKNRSGDNPFRYKEKDIVAIQSGAMLDITPCVMHDMYVKRRKKLSKQGKPSGSDKDKYGRVDYWALHKFREQAHNLFIEAKHYSTASLTDLSLLHKNCAPHKQWKQACQQIRDIKSFLQSDGYTHTRRIAFQSMFFYRYEKLNKKANNLPHALQTSPTDIVLNASNRLYSKEKVGGIEARDEPNWIAAWEIPAKYQRIRYAGYDEPHYIEFNPVIGFYARIES